MIEETCCRNPDISETRRGGFLPGIKLFQIRGYLLSLVKTGAEMTGEEVVWHFLLPGYQHSS